MKTKLYYLVAVVDCDADPHEMTDAEFAAESVRQNNVKTPDDFQDAFNSGYIAPGDCFLRILDATYAESVIETATDDDGDEYFNWK